MNELTIRNLDDMLVLRLKQLAWREGKPLEEIARRLFVEAANADGPNTIDKDERPGVKPMVHRTQSRGRTPAAR
jgi:hypothetical protein